MGILEAKKPSSLGRNPKSTHRQYFLIFVTTSCFGAFDGDTALHRLVVVVVTRTEREGKLAALQGGQVRHGVELLGFNI